MQESYLGQVLLVGIGGFVGSVSRFMVTGWVQRLVPWTTLPIGTLVVNVVGCFAIGVVSGLVDLRQALGPAHRVFLMVGILGGFTTFSTFSFETLELVREGAVWRAGINVVLQLVLGLVAAWVGFGLVRYL